MFTRSKLLILCAFLAVMLGALLLATPKVEASAEASPPAGSTLIYTAFQRTSVYKEPSTASTRLTRIKANVEYPVIDYPWNPTEGWACIEYKTGQPCGWVLVWKDDKVFGQVVFQLGVIYPQ